MNASPELYEVPMAKKKIVPPPAPEPENRVTVANVKGSEEEREYMRRLSRVSGVPIAEIIRRGIAMWAGIRNMEAPPSDWVGK